VARHVDAVRLLARGRAKVDRATGRATGKSVDHLLAAAKQRGRAGEGGLGNLDAKLAAVRAQIRAGRRSG